MKPKALTAADLAALIGMNPATIRSRASRGESLPPILRSNPLMFDAKESQVWAREHLDWLSVAQAAQCLAMSEADVRKHIAAGGRPRQIPPCIKRNRKWAFKSRDVAAFIKRSKST